MSSPTLTVSGPAAEVVASDGSVVLNVPIALKRRSGRRVVTLSGAEPVAATRAGATPLQLALARGHRWLRMLETGEAASMCDIARREGTNHSYVARHINLTLLAPDIVAAILDETLPEGVQLLSLAINPPMLWEDQWRWRVGMTT
ncbi:MAG: LacI family transcriptional regulator [Xanthomonadales bacterium]|nr:LacI family transcriptional regulator [Xanthomonadales bacterium]